jgi:hypothetical protein
MAEYINPLDFRKILIEYFLGSTELFVFAFMIIFSFVCAKFGISNRIFLLLLTISGLIMFGAMGLEAIYILIILLISYVAFKGIASIVT